MLLDPDPVARRKSCFPILAAVFSLVTKFIDIDWAFRVAHKFIFLYICLVGYSEFCVGHPFAYVTHFVFFRVVWIRTQRAAVASRRATNLATHLPEMGG